MRFADALIKRVPLVLPLVLLILFSTSSCKRGAKDDKFKEGIIEYSITYYDDLPTNYDNNLRPDKMIVRFRDNNTVNRIEALSGAFTFSFIQDLDTRTTTTLVKILNKKLYYQEPIVDSQYHFAYDAMPKLTIEKTEETIEFLGFKCNKAIATYADSTWQPFEIIYTNDIKVKSPNFNTPFEDIDGIMLKFSVGLFNQKMEVLATSIKPAKLAKDEFSIPIDFEEVNQETMREVIYLFQ